MRCGRRTWCGTRASSGSTSLPSPAPCNGTRRPRGSREDVDSADLSGVTGTPTFFVNGLRHHGEYDIASLTEAIRLAKARSVVGR